MKQLDWIIYLPGDYTGCPLGSIVTVVDSPTNAQLDGIDGAFLAVRGLRALIIATCSEEMFVQPDLFSAYLTRLKVKLAAKGIVPWGIMVEEEWFDRVNNWASVGGWACMSGLSQWQRKDFVAPRLRELFRRTKVMFPTIPSVHVETKWNENRASGSDVWYPDCGAEILGVDAYLYADGWPYVATPPLDVTTGPVMQEKFEREVGWMLKGSPDGRITGAVSRQKPIILVGQAFRDVAGVWCLAPTPQQLHWFFDLAQATPRVLGMAWFCWQSTAGLTDGMSILTDHAIVVNQMYHEMITSPPTPPPPPPPAGHPVDTLVSSDGRWILAMQTDGNLVVYRATPRKAVWWSGVPKKPLAKRTKTSRRGHDT